MPLFISHKEVKFGVGDRVRVTQKILEGEKNRQAIFEGVVISIKAGENPAFVVRRIGEQKIGIERIFPAGLPSIEKVEVLKRGTAGVAHAKLYYIRGKSSHEIDKIYARANRRQKA
jgi:large subunit ribosomal protein L19